MLAPGDGEAEPGVTTTNFKEPAKQAIDVSRSILVTESGLVLTFICRPLRGLGPVLVRFPGLGFAIARG